ncbi:MAG: hypothetical protein K9N55_12245, partial [Phycisphaerae bacterium]|nr:hypothetical protein [Phycisphaerae bacterium]
MACRARCVFELSVCVFIVSVFLGCDGPKTGVKTGNTEDGIPWPGGTYTPKFPPGIEALEAAKKDLTELLRTDTRDDCAGIRYYGELDFSKPANRDNPVAYMTRVDAYMVIRNARGEFQYMLPRSGFTVLDDRITVGTVFTLFYADLLESQIAIDKNPDGEIRTSWLGTDHKIYNDTDAAFAKYSKRYRPMYMRPHRVQCTGLISFFFKSQTGAERFADDLFFIQQTLKKQNDERLALFESKAAQYRDMAVKPEMSQAQRRYIVQADVLATQQKD